MSPFLPPRGPSRAPVAFAIAVLAAAAPSAAAPCSVTFTTPDSIRAAELTYEGCDVTVSGTTLVIAGEHAFASLRVTANGLVVSPALDSLRLTITGDVTIDAGSRVSMNGRGYPLGSGPGSAGGSTPAPGGSHGGRGGLSAGRASGPTCGSLTAPTTPGSGGSISGVSAGRGGGALRLAVGGMLRVDGTLSADGDTASTLTPAYSPGGGAGGSMYLDAGTLEGAGTISANGGKGYGQGSGGGGGRIAIAYGADAFTGAIAAIGGTSTLAGHGGAAGTIWRCAHGAALGELLVSNGGMASTARTDVPDSITVVAGDLVVRDAGVMGVAALRTLDLTVAGDATIAAGSAISMDGLGFPIGQGPGAGGIGTPAGGGSFGGRGGDADRPSGPTYGDFAAPAGLGSGGGISGVSQSSGGGALRLTVNGALQLDGELSARGDTATTLTPTYSPGGSSGGSVRVTAASLAGTGLVDASGARGLNDGAGGGGGRIAIEYGTNTFTGELRACGAPASVAGRGGAAGTIWTRAAGAPLGELLVANGDRWTLARTELPDSETVLAGTLEVRDAGQMGIGALRRMHLTVQGDVHIRPGAALSVDGRGYVIGGGPGAGIIGSPASGGSHGGRGGYSAGASKPAYGDPIFPDTFGSGGGVSGVSKATGGGILQLDVAGEIRVDGRLSARGDSATTITPGYQPGGGSGGSIRVTAGVISGTGTIDAGGGPGINGGGGGGGGRIAIHSLCWDGFSTSQLRVEGGAGGTTPAGPGTISPDFEVGIAAGPIATSGALRVAGYPRSPEDGAAESADTLAVFKERGGMQLAAGDTVRLEVSEPGAVADTPAFTPAMLGPGTWLNSHVVHLDPPGAGAAYARGSVTFDTNVLGVIVTTAGLDASQPLLRKPGVGYALGDPARGLELAAGDTVEISADRRTVTVTASAASELDEVRIVTAVPLSTCGPVAGVRDPAAPATALLAPPFPNPARGEVALRFALAAPAHVRLAIYDVAGRQVAVLADGPRAAGWHALDWRADRAAPSGVYFARLEAGGAARTARIVLHR